MTTKIVLSKSGMGIEEGTVIRWLKAVGDRVEQGEIVVEVENAKAVQEIAAPVGGSLAKIFVQAEESVPVNSVLGEIDGT